jgi:hypothetical protein
VLAGNQLRQIAAALEVADALAFYPAPIELLCIIKCIDPTCRLPGGGPPL